MPSGWVISAGRSRPRRDSASRRPASPCYRPSQFQQAYDLKPLYASHLNGRGRTIIIVNSFGSPTIQRDLATFDKAFGLPAPPSFKVLQPVGKVPPFDPH